MRREKTTDLEFEARREKKKLKQKRKKDEPDRNSSLIEVSEEKMHMLVQVQKFDKNGGINEKSGEGANKKKKRKRGMEEADSELKSNLTNDQEPEDDCEKSNGKITEEVNFADNEKKRKKFFEDDKMGEAAKRFQCSEDSDIDNNGEGDKKKMKKKEKREKVDGEGVQKIITDGKEAGVESEHSDGKIMEKGGIMKKEKRNHKKKSGSQMRETVVEKLGTENSRIEGNNFLENDGNVQTTGDETRSGNIEVVYVEDSNKRKKRAKSKKHVNVGDCNEDEKEIAKSDKGSLKAQKNVRAPNLSEKSTPRKPSKRVSFSDVVQVFPQCDAPKDAEKGLVQGKRFSEEEDKLVKEAVLTYIEEHRLGDEGIDKVLNCRSNPQVKNCWKDIGAALPWRPSKSIYYRAHILFERGKERNWTPEEYEEVRRAAMESKDKGEAKPNWRKVGNELGKHRIHVKDAWRRIKLPNMKKGHWSQEEYKTLFDLVNKDLQMRALEEKKSKHGMLRDNIKWESISETLGTRTNPACCQKWYYQLTSPLVAEGVWADADDYRLLYALDSLDACCMEDVDWDNVLEHRSGDVCRKRWNQMVKHIGQYGNKSFAEKVEILSKRYCADALEAREVFDSKPAVDSGLFGIKVADVLETREEALC
ncbi:PREDICTED: RNA polymerase I termination factor-like isoform X3 [Prunus mume]|uniref:RNA polymerase I termination factor-like isoform X3 n=1 Tax=Prunus mume TaxID=102107 RepID=A0ABM0NKI8_PRUMU|nr:PREDICTED: RNA polymerase I termination factor-like isoform X3 [Prunus mume]